MRGVLLGGGGYTLHQVSQTHLVRVDLDAPEPTPTLFACSFLPHGFAFDPRDSARVAVFEKKGQGACVIDVRSGDIERALSPGAGRQFYGHGAFSADGSLLYSTESVLAEGGRGVLAVRDGRTLAVLGELPTHGASPHDCVLREDGRTMVVANGGGAFGVRGASMPCVTVVDVSAGKLLEKITIPSPRFNAGHVALSARGDMVIVSAPRDGVGPDETSLGAVTLRLGQRRPLLIEQPRSIVERMLGETLSVAIDHDGALALATHPLGDMVSAWSLRDGTSRGAIELPVPRGATLTLDGARFVISHRAGADTMLSFFDARTLEPVGSPVTPSRITGSHIVVREITLR